MAPVAVKVAFLALDEPVGPRRAVLPLGFGTD